MKIVYISDPDNLRLPDYDILKSLKKKHEVKVLNVRKLDLKKAIKKVLACDLIIFHGQMGKFDSATYYFVLEQLKILMEGSNAKKALWMLDKIWGPRFQLLQYFYDSVDYIFVNDDTWLRRFRSEKIFPLHPGLPERKYKGHFKKELACDIAYFGEIYGRREDELKFLRDKFGGRLKVFNNKFGKDLADLCVSAKIVVIPQAPFDDFFWSDRIYRVMDAGGFVLHPRTQGLTDEGFIDGIHYMTYVFEQELFATISMLLDKRADKTRKGIARNGQHFVRENFTYDKRINQIIEKVNEVKNIS